MSKWLPDVDPSDRAVEVAVRALTMRLDRVRRYLKRSVHRPGVAENVHQLRVWTRRTEAALHLFEDLLPPRRARKLRKVLARIRRSAGRVRDCDVFGQRTSTPDGRWPISLREERRQAQLKLDRLYARLDRGRMLRKLGRRLIERMEKRQRDSQETLRERADRTLKPLAQNFLALASGAFADPKTLHRFRIAGKQLRYALELLAGAYPSAFRERFYPVLSALQERLGAANDLAVAHDRLKAQWKPGLDQPRRELLAERIEQTGRELTQARLACGEWWTSEGVVSARTCLQDFLGDDLSRSEQNGL